MKISFTGGVNFSAATDNAAASKSWKETDNKLYRKFEFKNFSEAFAFMTRVALEAEKMDHHPLWTNVYNTVEVWLSTHDAGDVVTEKDRKLSKKIDAIIG